MGIAKKTFAWVIVLSLVIQTFPLFVFANTIEGWDVILNNGMVAQAQYDTNVKYDGNASLRLSSQSGIKRDVYFMLRQFIKVKQGKTYRYGFWAKGDNVVSSTVSISWGTRTALNAFGKNWEWKHYEMQWNSGKESAAEFQLVMEGQATAFWLDGFEFYECDAKGNRIGENLFANANFESGIPPVSQEQPTQTVSKTETQDLRQDMIQSEQISVLDFEKTLGLGTTAPAVYNSNIKIDADDSDWDKAIAITIPAKEEQKLTFAPEVGNVDLKAKFSFSYDENNIYISAKVHDDVHYSLDNDMYWSADSLQFTVSCTSEAYGHEIGIIHTMDGKANVFCATKTADEIKSIQAATKREGTNTYYEVAVPWDMTILKEKSNILICALVNDNDGKGRIGCVEMAPGISQSKNSSTFFTLPLLEKGQTGYGVIEGARTAVTGRDVSFSLFFVNKEEDAQITYTLPNDQKESVHAKVNQVLYVPFVHKFEQSGKYDLKINLKTPNKEYVITAPVQIILSMEYFDLAIKKLEQEELPEFSILLNECKGKNITIDYETVNYQTASMFVPYIKDSLLAQQYLQADYELTQARKLCREGVDKLKAYLNGSEKPLNTYKYVTGDISLDGKTVWADMKNSKTGEVQRRPMFGVGYGHFSQAQKDMPVFEELGANAIQIEIGASNVIKSPSDIRNWDQITNMGGINKPLDVTFSSVKNARKGKGTAMKITSKEPVAANRYTYKVQRYPVKENTTYTAGFSAKGINSSVWVSVGGWVTDRITLAGTFDWKDFTYEFTTQPGQSSMEFFVFSENITDECYINNVSVKEQGDDKNLIVNGDFDDGGDFPVVNGMKIDTTDIYHIVELLQRAEEENVSVNLLTAFHYFPEFIRQENPDEINFGNNLGHFYGGFANVNLNSPRVREVIETFLRTLIPLIKDYKSLNGICVSNEPAFCTAVGNSYLPMYHEYLQKKFIHMSELNKVYQTNYATFDDVPFPQVTGDPKGKTAHFYDWFEFNNQVQADFYKFYTGIIREIAPNIPLKMKFMANTFGVDHQYFRQWLITGTDAELAAQIYDYNGCDVHGYLYDNYQTMLTKMRWYDFMSSMANKPVFDSEAHIIPDKKLDVSPQQATWWAADTWEGAVHGRTMMISWVWEHTYNPSSDFYGSILMRPDVVASSGKTALDLNRLSYEIKALQDVMPQIAILQSNPSWNYSEVYQNAMYSAWEASLFSGQKTGFATESQAAQGKLNDYKLIIVPLCNQVKKKTLEALNAYVKNGGKILIVGNESLKYDEHNAPFDSAMYQNVYASSTVVDATTTELVLSSPSGKTFRDIIYKELEKLGLNSIKLIDTQTNEVTYSVEFLAAQYDGGYVMNLNNFSWDGTKNVYLELNGKRISNYKELRSDKSMKDMIALEPYKPLLIRVEMEDIK